MRARATRCGWGAAPEGEQMDFVEVMEIDDGLIHAHRVYWGWRGVDIILQDQYHRDHAD